MQRSLCLLILLLTCLSVPAIFAESVSLPGEDAQTRFPSSPVEAISQQANTLARNLGQALGEYVKGKRMEVKKKGIVQDFDIAFDHFTRQLDLDSGEMDYLLWEVENAYIRDAELEKPELDQQGFRDLANVIKKEYAEMKLETLENGSLNTYYYSGEIKTRWEYKDRRPHGDVVTYYPNGEILYIDIYDQGKRLSRKKYDAEGRLLFEQDYSYAGIQKSEEKNVSDNSHE